MARAFVGSQLWFESGLYADSGLLEHGGHLCLCNCDATPEGVFCSGAGVSGSEKVASFLGVFAVNDNHNPDKWEGDLIAYENTKPFADKFYIEEGPGSGSYYIGVSQSLEEKSFVWRGRMEGVSCEGKESCKGVCEGARMYEDWYDDCK